MPTTRENKVKQGARRSKQGRPGSKTSLKLARARETKYKSDTVQRGPFMNIKDPGKRHIYRIPRSFLPQLRAYLEQLEKGRPAQIINPDHTLTTQEAADLLNVSRPHVVKLIEAGELQHTMVGTHRRLYSENVLAFRDAMKFRRATALQKLADDAQEMDLGY